VVEVAMEITIMVALRQPLRLRCTTVNRHHIVMGAVASLVITRTVHRTLLGHHHHINTGKGTDPGHTHHRPRIAGTLTRMAVGETHHGLVRTVGADITLGPRAEADTVEVVGDIVVAAAVGVVMVMEAAEEGLTTLRYIRAATILASTIADIVQAVEAHREDAVEVEVTELWLPIRLGGHGHFYSYYFLELFVFVYVPLVSYTQMRSDSVKPGYFSLCKSTKYTIQLHGSSSL